MKKNYDQAINRLALIIHKLSKKELPTVKDLAEDFNVSVRTIQRDISERLISFPIERDQYGRLKFIEGYSLAKTTLGDDEMLITYLALSQLKNINESFDHNIDRVLNKLLYPTFNTIFHIKPENFEPLDTNSEKVIQLEKAIKDQLVASITINNKQIQIEPYKILNLEGIWYLLALDKDSKKIRPFLLANIKSVKTTLKKYQLNRPINKVLAKVHSGFFEDGNSITVTIKVYQDIAQYFKIKEFIPTQKIIEELDDGSIIVSFEVTHYEDIDNIIKSWLPHVEVLEPIEYKNQFINELRNYMNNLTF